jgi:hypothetical protein
VTGRTICVGAAPSRSICCPAEEPHLSRTALTSIEVLEERRLLSIGTPLGVTIHTEATDRFSGTFGILQNFVPPPIAGPAAVGLQETINWGDGTTPTAGTLAAGPIAREYLVKGSHTYARTGTFNVTVNVVWGPLPGSGIEIASVLLTTIHSKAIVAKDEDGGVTLTETAGKPFKATLGSFDFRNVDLLLSATIDWGDGTHSVGTVTGDLATGELNVVAAHTYAKTGTYQVHVKVLSHLAGSPATTPSGTIAQWISIIKVVAAS